MTDEAFNKYWDERYVAQQRWYSARARTCRKKYFAWHCIQLGLAASTTIFVGLNFTDLAPLFKTLALIASAATTVATAVLKLFKYEENWLNYRQTSEALKKEQYYYTAGLDAYASATDAKVMFVARVESLISRESDRWASSAASLPKSADGKGETPPPH